MRSAANDPMLFHNLPESEQKRRAARYVRAKAAMHAEGILYDDTQGMIWKISTPATYTIMWPHKGNFIMKIQGKGKTSGNSMREFLQLFKRLN